MTNEELIKKATSVIHFRESKNSSMGGVGCALITDKGNVYLGVCIDTGCGMGFCAEHNAIGSAITSKEYVIKKIVAVWKDDRGDLFVGPPCGRCREFMRQIDEANLKTEVIIDKDKTIKLKELLPYHEWWQQKVT